MLTEEYKLTFRVEEEEDEEEEEEEVEDQVCAKDEDSEED